MNPQSQPTIFQCQGSPSKQVLKNSLVVIVVFLILIWPYLDQVVKLFSDNPTQILNDIFRVIIPLIIGVIIAYLLFFYKNIYKTFNIDEQGINVGNSKYPWNDIKNFHMLGDSQDERTGLVGVKYFGGFDLYNPYRNLGIYVLKMNGILSKTIRLQVSPEKSIEFENILTSHGVVKESKLKMYLTGVNKWFIILFLVPFGLLVLYFLYGILFVF